MNKWTPERLIVLGCVLITAVAALDHSGATAGLTTAGVLLIFFGVMKAIVASSD